VKIIFPQAPASRKVPPVLLAQCTGWRGSDHVQVPGAPTPNDTLFSSPPDLQMPLVMATSLSDENAKES
jgi:hypothetical protein